MAPEHFSPAAREDVARLLESWARQIRAAQRVTGHVNQDQTLGELDPVVRNGHRWADWYPTARTLDVSLTIELDPPSEDVAA